MAHGEEFGRIVSQFFGNRSLLNAVPYGDGHIHSTYLISVEGAGEYILQHINRFVFPNPKAVMENIQAVTEHVSGYFRARGIDPERKTLEIVPTLQGELYYLDAQGEYWRIYKFISGAVTYQTAGTPELFYLAAKGFGSFQRLMEGFAVERLHETIRDFHNTPVRFEQLSKAAREDRVGRMKDVAPEYAFVLQRQGMLSLLTDAAEKGDIPIRVTHNDTKLNNILFDRETGRELCVIDLDTVMPGLSLYDFGDAVRFGASTAAEDEKDLSKVRFSLPHFEAYVKGYRDSAGETLTALEYEWMPEGAKLMTLECGMRFLADYLNGDVYFKTTYPEHNLDRARTQFTLVHDMERKWDEMKRAAVHGA